jgi:hypothetical protein
MISGRSILADGSSLVAPSAGSRRRRGPDGVAKREASAYPGTGLVIAIYDDLVIGYVLDGDVVLFSRIQKRADLHEDAT